MQITVAKIKKLLVIKNMKNSEKIPTNLPELKIDELFKFLIKQKILKKRDVFLLNTYKFNDVKRIQNAIDRETPTDVVRFVAYIESKNDFYFDDAKWMGQDISSVLLNYLKTVNKLIILYLGNKKAWYVWNGRFWEFTNKQIILKIIRNEISNLRYAGLGPEVKSLIVHLAETVYYIETWPKTLPAINFLNGILEIRNQKLQLIPHHPSYYFRKIINKDFDIDQTISPLMMKFLLDISGGSIYNLNLLRFLLFTLFFPGQGNIGFYVYGPKGSSKSTPGLSDVGGKTLINFLSELFPYTVTSIETKTITKRFQENQLKGKDIVFLKDVNPNELNSSVISFIRRLTGGDSLIGEVKYKENFNFVFQGTLVLINNYEVPFNVSFDDATIYDRLIHFTITGIKNEYKSWDLKELLKKDFSGMIRWVLGINPEMPKTFLRATKINKIIALDKPVHIAFFMEKLAFQEEAFTSTEEILHLYNQFLIEHHGVKKNKQQILKNKSLKINANQLREKLLNFYYSLVDSQKDKLTNETNFAKNKKRGYYHIVPQVNDHRVVNYQFFNKKANIQTKNLLEENPCIHHGITLRSETEKYVNLPFKYESLTEYPQII